MGPKWIEKECRWLGRQKRRFKRATRDCRKLVLRRRKHIAHAMYVDEQVALCMLGHSFADFTDTYRPRGRYARRRRRREWWSPRGRFVVTHSTAKLPGAGSMSLMEIASQIPWEGCMADEVQVWEHALTRLEIDALMCKPLHVFTRPPVSACDVPT